VIGGLVLAAGAGTRFGGGKLLAELDGRPLLEHVLRTTATAPLGRAVVVLGADAPALLERVDLHGAEPVVCERWSEGQSASLACGLAALEGQLAGDRVEAAVIVLGDQPRVTAEAIRRVIAARAAGSGAVRATYGGRPGHPVLVERSLFAPLREVAGDLGGRNVLRAAGAREVACDDLGGGEDVDTLEQLEALR
jgi:molybdenum cofactor cytidylyltransferase